MPTVVCNRQNPHIVVPHLIVRTPLPAGTEVVSRTEIGRLEYLIACVRGHVETLKAWRITVDEHITNILSHINTKVDPFLVQSGMIMLWPATSIPAGWLICDGSVLNRVEYADIFSAIGTSFNTGGELATTFRLPNFESRFVKGWESGTWGDGANLFAGSTAAPVAIPAIPTSSGGSGTHNHGLGTGWGTSEHAGHTHSVTIADANAAHSHGAGDLTGAAGSHDHGGAYQTEAEGGHYHAAGSVYGVPSPEYGNTGPAGAHTHTLPVKYLSVEMEQAGEATHYLWDNNLGSVEDNPAVTSVEDHAHTVPPTEAVAAHQHWMTILNTGTSHQHGISSANANHGHTGSSVVTGGVHSHSITLPAGSVTADATVAAHTHTVDKTTGWDSETKPDGIWMNFIIKR